MIEDDKLGHTIVSLGTPAIYDVIKVISNEVWDQVADHIEHELWSTCRRRMCMPLEDKLFKEVNRWD